MTALHRLSGQIAVEETCRHELRTLGDQLWIWPSRVPLKTDAVHLVDVTADSEAKTILWERLTEIPLGESTA